MPRKRVAQAKNGRVIHRMLSLMFVYSGDFGERCIRNLINDPSFCKSCGLECDFCKYGVYSYVQSIIAAVELLDPSKLPAFIEEPENFFPRKIPNTDLCVTTGIHKDLLLALPSRLSQEGVRGLIAPIEDFKKVPTGLRKQVEEECRSLNIECAFPKPFCSLKPEKDKPLISQFIHEFKIGQPRLEIFTRLRGKAKVIEGVVVERSAPCGSTWYIAKKLVGVEVHRDLIRDVVARAHHSYPCTATMVTDSEINEPILHKAGYMIREEVERNLFPAS